MTSKTTSKSKFLAAAVAAALMAVPASAVATTGSPPQTAAAATATVNWEIALKAGPSFPKATGAAQYQSQPGQKELQVEVEHLTALVGKSVAVSVNGVRVGWAKVSVLGIAQLSLNTELGQAVPTIVHGSTVAVRSAGTLVASGRF